MKDHQPLDTIDALGEVLTAGRLHQSNHESGWRIRNARASLPVDLSEVDLDGRDGALLGLEARWDGAVLRARSARLLAAPRSDSSFSPEVRPHLADAVEARDRLNRTLRSYFQEHDFREVETPKAVPAPGTDLYIEPVATRSLTGGRRGGPAPYLHTSPEFAMKRLLSEGFERIYQLGPVWRDGEVTDRHHPEFTLLEWYRAWEGVDAIMADVEEIVVRATGGTAIAVTHTNEGTTRREIPLEPPFRRMTMQELVDAACGFDILEALDYRSLRRQIVERDLLGPGLDRRHPPADADQPGRWDELFFELMVSRLDPHLAKLGGVFVTEWPAPLAVLARTSEEDPRLAHRFELYVGGVELANGFDELTDPDEQRARFAAEIEERRALDKPDLPMPEDFLQALEYGLPPSSGVALGVDRLLMVQLGVGRIDRVAPFAHRSGMRG